MTTPQPQPFSLSVDAGPPSAVLRVAGGLDYETHGELVKSVTSLLTWHPLRELTLDLSRLDAVDSSGLSALLLIRRRTDEAGVVLRLDRRPAVLERLLDRTGTLELLTGPAPVSGRQHRPGAG
ncbi:STAS domain-containing protein [Streptomyces sp. NPDC046831]|uniref:STAS domain-containing protein n=1 Tax=Streptomyces sp. NPDC046831 TaxID=3154805 RepID=UPI0033E9C325